jgi:hypothetical protein
MREPVSWGQDRLVVAAAVLASGRGWAVLVQAMMDAEATAQMIRALNTAAFLTDLVIGRLLGLVVPRHCLNLWRGRFTG